MNFGGRPKVWLARTSFPHNRARETGDVYSWMLDVFPTVRGNKFIVLAHLFHSKKYWIDQLQQRTCCCFESAHTVECG